MSLLDRDGMENLNLPFNEGSKITDLPIFKINKYRAIRSCSTYFSTGVGVLEPGVPQPASEFVLRAPNPGW